MAGFLRDYANNQLMQVGIVVREVTTTTTGAAVDMISGDGRCNCIIQVSTISGDASKSITIQIQESTASGSGMANITGAALTVSATGITAFSFDRTKQYLQAVVTTVATTSNIAVQLHETRKTF